MFDLLDDSDQSRVLEACKRLKAKQEACYQCCDIEFSSPLLGYLSVTNSDGAPCHLEAVQQLLTDIAVHAPISSDVVECRHGFTQSLLHRWRGCKPSDSIAQERTLWNIITRSFGKFKDWMKDRFSDHRLGYRLHRFGQTSANQYTQKKSACGVDEALVLDAQSNPQKHCTSKSQKGATLSTCKMDKLLAFEQKLRMPRKVCGSLLLPGKFLYFS